MSKIYEVKNSIVFENNFAEVTICKNDGTVEEIIDKTTGKSIKGDAQKPFIYLLNKEDELYPCKGLTLNGNTITAEFEQGKFDVEVKTFDNYFTFEVTSPIPSSVYKAGIAHLNFEYDYTDKENTGAVSVAMTVPARTVHFPNAYAKETLFLVYPHLEDVGAKCGIIIAPIVKHKDIIKELCLTIDRNKGLVSSMGGAWSRDTRIPFSNYTIQSGMSTEFMMENLPYYKQIGVDQIDIHKGINTFRQGDFKFMKHDSPAQFKKEVADVYEKEGIALSLHTYSCYIEYTATDILTVPEYQKQIKVNEYYTLADDISNDAAFVPTLESTDHVPDEFHGYMIECPFLLIDEEIIHIGKGKNGFEVVQRGACGTTPAPHKKDSEVRFLECFYSGFCPDLNSDLFLQIARNTAKAYNEGGFKMIYLDALDGIIHNCDGHNEYWYYSTKFICELLKYCNTDPILEQSAFIPSYWASRGRIGAWDVCRHGYKPYNEKHAKSNMQYIDSYNAPTMGWYHYYPNDEKEPGNVHVKYEHWDTVNHFGALSVMYDFSTVFNNTGKDHLVRYAGVKRNILLYKKYDDLRKAQYFSEDYRKKLIANPFEKELIEKRGKKFSFVEKSYQVEKLYDLNDDARSTKLFKNPFGAQVPFIRIEALMSTLERNPLVLLPLDEDKDLLTQNLTADFSGYLNLSNYLAKKVRVYGNGKGGKICIKANGGPRNNAPNYQAFIIDIDFKGWRDYVLIEDDNGERTDHGFEIKENEHHVYRSPYQHDKNTRYLIQTEGDMDGVRMSSVIAYEHLYDVLKNPTVKIGDMEIMFECELMSSDFIEFDGKEAKVIDRYGNEKKIWFKSNLKAPRGKFKATLTAKSLNRATPRAQITLGFTGKEIK